MMAGALGLLVGLALLIGASEAVKYHKNRIAEKGSRFNQRVLISRKSGVEIFHVPAHNGLMALRELYDFNKGQVLRCHSKTKSCFLAKFDKKNYESPAKLEKNLRAFEKRYHSPGREERKETVRNENLVIVDSNPIKAGKLLTPLMRKFLGSYKLYREKRLPKGAKVIKDDGKKLVGPKRGKRGVVGSCPASLRYRCRYNRYPVIKYVKTPRANRSCERVRHCNRYGRCYWKHLTTRSYYQCCCCPEHYWVRQCYAAFAMCTYKHRYG